MCLVSWRGEASKRGIESCGISFKMNGWNLKGGKSSGKDKPWSTVGPKEKKIDNAPRLKGNYIKYIILFPAFLYEKS